MLLGLNQDIANGKIKPYELTEIYPPGHSPDIDWMLCHQKHETARE